MIICRYLYCLYRKLVKMIFLGPQKQFLGTGRWNPEGGSHLAMDREVITPQPTHFLYRITKETHRVMHK